MLCGVRLLPCVVAFAAALAWGEPRVPSDPDEVLERLPRGIGTLRDIADRPQRPLADTLALAERAVALGRAENDPRYYGYAEGLLAPLLAAPEPPARARVLGAMVLQSRHDFAGALAALAVVLAESPRDAQAWLIRATIERVTGNYGAARASCARLASLVETLIVATCIASVAALDNQAEAAASLLQRALAVSAAADPELRQWSLTTLAEVAILGGHPQQATALFERALAERARSLFTLLAAADHLLDVGRPEAVIRLLDDENAHDGALLRLALAARASEHPRAADYALELSARMAAARLRGDTLHQADAARHALVFDGDAQRALDLALENWSTQREPRDTRLLLEAALAAGQPAAAAEAIAFLDRHRVADRSIAALRGALVASRGSD